MYVERSELVVPLKTKQKDVPLKVALAFPDWCCWGTYSTITYNDHPWRRAVLWPQVVDVGLTRQVCAGGNSWTRVLHVVSIYIEVRQQRKQNAASQTLQPCHQAHCFACGCQRLSQHRQIPWCTRRQHMQLWGRETHHLADPKTDLDHQGWHNSNSLNVIHGRQTHPSSCLKSSFSTKEACLLWCTSIFRPWPSIRCETWPVLTLRTTK